MKIDKTHGGDLENFDSLFIGHPADIEKKLKCLLPQALALESKSIYLQILSQIALTQAMQKNINKLIKHSIKQKNLIH